MPYDVEVALYEGPLPLLVELTKLRLIDLFLVKLVDLTHDYLVHVKAEGVELNALSEPLPLLGHLLALKARGLLPEPPVVDGEEEVPIGLEELERRLKEYEQFKTVAQLLAELHALQHQHFTRPPSEVTMPASAEASDAPFDVSLTDLMSAFAKVVSKASAPVYEVVAEPWTVEMKVQELRVLLSVKGSARFLDLFTPQQTKLELVVTFLALLELIRQHVARAVQEQVFSDIVIASMSPAPPTTPVSSQPIRS